MNRPLADITIGDGCLISDTAIIEPGVTIGDRVILDGDNIKLCQSSYVSSGAIIGANVVMDLLIVRLARWFFNQFHLMQS